MIFKRMAQWTFIFISLLSPVQPSMAIQDKASLQRGAKLFMNYCSGCHSLKYIRYNQMAKGLGLTDKNGEVDVSLLNNLMFTRAAPYDPVNSAIPPEDAIRWFGINPPDLSLSARVRGSNWLFHYLKGFYQDASKPFGTNNVLVPDVAMPNALEPLIGQMILVQNSQSHSSSLSLVKSGEMSSKQADAAVRDLVTFLTYVAEPAKLVRYHLGLYGILFLCILLIPVYLLKKLYWQRLLS